MGATNTTIGEWVLQSAERAPDRPALVEWGGSTFTFAELNARVNQLVHALAERGVGRGDRLAILARDSVGFVETVLAAMKLGATYVPLNYRLRPAEVDILLDRARPAVLFHDARYATEVAGLASTPGLLVCYDGDDDQSAASTRYGALLDGASTAEPPVVADDADVLGLAFTSGTTGLPKGVLQSQGMIKHLVWNVMVDYRLRAGEVRYAAAPLFHISGLAMALMGIAIGSTSIIAPQFDPADTLEMLATDQLDACFMVPTMISSVLAQPGATSHAYDRLQLMLYGAAPMSPTLLRRAIDTFRCDFLNAFGAGTEAGLQTVLTPEDHRRALAGEPHLLGSIGKPATGVSLRLLAGDGTEVGPGEVGEIATRSDWVMDGYLDMPAETARALRDGWFRAGDLATRDDEGYLYLAGRKNDMLIRGGENVYPIEIETVLSEHPAVEHAVVVGRPDDHWGETVCAFVSLHAGANLDAAELIEQCRARLASYKVPAEIHVVGTMPTNSSGKIIRQPLRDLLRTTPKGTST